MLPFHKIVCPTDFSPSSRAALHKAGEFAAHFDAKLCVLHVVPPLAGGMGFEASNVIDYQSESLAEAKKQVLELIETCVPRAVDSQALVRLGSGEAEKIAEVARAEEADLIIIATHGETGWRHMVFGSVTEKLLHLAGCPVLVIHAPQK